MGLYRALFNFFLLVLYLCFSSTSLAQLQTNSYDTAFLQDGKFLKVDEAYKVEIEHVSLQQLLIKWQIKPGYYLYGEQFKILLNNKELPYRKNRNGKVIYDEFFKTNKEVFFGYIELTTKVKQLGVLALNFQGCAEKGLCYPPHQYFFNLSADNITPITQDEVLQLSASNASIDNQQPLLIVALLFAFIGGLILNFMPCVFPLLSVKVLTIVNHGNNQRHSWFYFAGVMSCFLLFAVVVITLKYWGEDIGWGTQLQSPIVVVTLIVLFFVMGLNLLDITSLGNMLVGKGGGLGGGHEYAGTYFSGFLAVSIATPCSAPFMASALGYTLLQENYVVLPIFVALGLGMALPMWVLLRYPLLLSFLPKSGTWLNTLKQTLALPMFLTAIWLLGVLVHQLGTTAGMLLLTCLVIIGFVLHFKPNEHWKIIYYFMGVSVIVGLLYASLNEREKVVDRGKFELQQLDTMVGQGRAVFVDVTADWCITCLVNKYYVMDNNKVKQAFEKANVDIVIADWTNPNVEIERLLRRYHRTGIPLYLWFDSQKKQAKVLPQILTTNLLVGLAKNE